MAYAATLMQSVRRHHPESRRVIVLADLPRRFPDLDLAADLVDCQELGIPLMENMALWYSILEFNTAIKPFAFSHFLARGAKIVCYLDPDIYVYRPLRELFTALRVHEAALTPHLLEPQGDQKEPSDLTILKSGVYNLGFLAVRDTKPVRSLLRWWADQTFIHCRADIAEHMFTDQRWMDMAPGFLTRPLILRHPGYNVAYWNIGKRAVRRRQNRWLAKDDELAFFHFSGFNPGDPESFSKHQNRLSLRDLGPATRLVEHYRARVLANQWRHHSRLAYGFATFRDGRKIEPTMRRYILRAIDEGRLLKSDALVVPSNYFDEPEPLFADKGAYLTRFMYQFWLDRSDLRGAFDIRSPAGLANYRRWFLSQGAALGVSAETIRAAMPTRQTREDGTRAGSETPFWPALAPRTWPGAAGHAAAYLSGDVIVSRDGFRLPSQLALLWERRADLRDKFDLTDPASLQEYVAWGLSDGVLQQAIDPSLLSDSFISYFAEHSRLGDRYGDVPITRGMLITQAINHDSGLLQAGTRFPAEAKGRIAHGLWFAFVAPRLFHWPRGMVTPVRDYFQQLTDVTMDGLQLNRGTVAVWELHPKLQRSFPLIDEQSVESYVRWLLFDGLPQLGLTLDDLDPRLRYVLARRSPRLPDINRLSEMVHTANPDLQTRFDLATSADRAALSRWVERSLSATYPHLVTSPTRPARATEDRATIGLTGLWESASGRGEDVRCSAKALDAVGFTDYRIIDLQSGKIFYPDGQVAPHGALRVDVNIVHHNADTAVEDWIALRRRGVSADRTIGFWAWELEHLPQSWLHAYSFFDEIWAASRFAFRAFYQPRLRPVRLVPMAVVPTTPKRQKRAQLAVPDDHTMFLFTFDYRSYVERKNPLAVIDAFARAFPTFREKTALVIKTLGADSAPAAHQALAEAVAYDNRIQLMDAVLSRREMMGLVAAADAYVSLHRSEGFGRGPAEAMLVGVPVIVTDYSGTTDFATTLFRWPNATILVPTGSAGLPQMSMRQLTKCSLSTKTH
jgi:glycosyltransferase involved in cell wall biosynthesis